MQQAQATEGNKPAPLQIVSKLKGYTSPEKWDKKNIPAFDKVRPIQETKKVRVLQYELNWDFRFGADLCVDKASKELKKAGKSLEDLKSGNAFAFVNHDQTRVRLLSIDRYGDPVSIVKAMPKGRYFDLRVLRHLPEAFNGPTLDVDKATATFLDTFFSQKKRRNPNLELSERQ